MKLAKVILAGMLIVSMLLAMVSCQGEGLNTETVDLGTTVTEEINPDEISSMPLDEYNIKDIASSIKLLGERTAFNEDGELVVEWSGSGFEVDINVGDVGTDLRLGVRCNYASRWGIFVDGVQWGEQVAITTGNKKQIVARDIPRGEHTIRVVKESQPNTNRNNYNNILTFGFNGKLMEKDVSDKDWFFEFVGDGYFVGLGNSGNSERASASKILNETNFTRSLPYLVSEAFGADYSVVAHSEIGILTKAGNYTIEELFENQFAYRDTETFYDPDRVPDAIFLHVGMDDSYEDLPAGEFILQGELLVNGLRRYYGYNVPVIWLYNTRFVTTRAGEIQAIAQRLGGDAGGVYAFECEYGTSGSSIDETGFYPSAAEHQKSAEKLIAFLKGIYGIAS